MKYIFLLFSILFLACAAVERSSEKVFSNANSVVKSKVFIQDENKEMGEDKTSENTDKEIDKN